MPNWCENELWITGKQGVADCLAEIGIEDRPISFQRIIPMPAELENTRSPQIIKLQKDIDRAWAQFAALPKEQQDSMGGRPYDLGITKRDSQALKGRFGTDNWYDWCVCNWGTKWDACEGKVLKSQPGKVVIGFDTAWNPPEPVIVALSQKYPKLKFKLKWWEGGMGVRGIMQYAGGNLVARSDHDYRGSRGG